MQKYIADFATFPFMMGIGSFLTVFFKNFNPIILHQTTQQCTKAINFQQTFVKKRFFTLN